MDSRIKPAALAAGLLFACAAFAGDDQVVVVSATRFAESDPHIPADISVITRQDIQNTPATNVPDLLKAAAGIEVRPLYGAMGIDATVDLGGFGDTAGSNTLVLLDGQRLNPIDSGSISWSTIPLASIQRIEIIRGAGTVLYGDRASGGVINIVTDKAGPSTAFAEGIGGSYAYRGADAGVAGSADGTTFRITGHYADTDGWRHNSQADQQAASGRVGHTVSRGEIFSDFAAYKDSNGLPGAVLSNDYRADPTRARTPFDSQHREGYRLRPGASLKLSDSLTFDAEVGVEHENYDSDNVSFASVFDRHRTTVSATPRLRWVQDLGGKRNQTVTGLDYYDGKVDATSIGMPSVIPQTAKQSSAAWYVQNVTELSDRWFLTVGGREQRMNQHALQGAYLANPGAGLSTVPSFDGSAVRTRAAFDGGLVLQGTGWRAFGKYGSIFRFANTDELFGFNPFTGNPVFAGDLLPQHGRIGELGASFAAGRASGRLSAYRMDLTDEIDFDGTTFANVNLPPTRRQGLEAEIDWTILARLKAHAAYTYIDARFREGPTAGNEIPLVARNKASLQLTSDNGRRGSYSIAITTVGGRRYSGDFANSLGNLAGYTTVDLRGRWTLARWTFTATLINALDRRYAPFAGYSTFVNDTFYYPADPRSLFAGVRYDLP
ncbi:MAG TPA: TonB-dependent receptor [Burkholderiaceae bacterium]|nr:TonB-dependent receptor [Burkholderiaceae bacterium]